MGIADVTLQLFILIGLPNAVSPQQARPAPP